VRHSLAIKVTNLDKLAKAL